MATDSRFASRESRIEHEEAIYQLIEDWIGGLPAEAAIEALDAAKVPAAPVNSIADLFADPQVAAREDIVRVPDSVKTMSRKSLSQSRKRNSSSWMFYRP